MKKPVTKIMFPIAANKDWNILKACFEAEHILAERTCCAL